MALNINDSSVNLVNFGKGAGLDTLNNWTVAWWCKYNTLGGFDSFFNKSNDANSFLTVFHFSGEYVIRVIHSTSRSNYLGGSPTTGAWSFAAVTFAAGGAPDHRLWEGTLTTKPVEETAWGTSTDGVGNVTDNSALDMVMGNFRPGSSSGIDGDWGWLGFWNRTLTEGEVWAQWLHPHTTAGCQINAWPGWNGTTNVPNWGLHANQGAIEGSPTVVAGVPLGPAFRGRRSGVPYIVPVPSGNILIHPGMAGGMDLMVGGVRG